MASRLTRTTDAIGRKAVATAKYSLVGDALWLRRGLSGIAPEFGNDAEGRRIAGLRVRAFVLVQA